MNVVLVSSVLLLSFVNSGCCLSDKLEQYIKSEETFISDLENYIENQESVLHLMRKKLLNFKVEHSEAKENQAYFTNELNTFLLFKRLASDIYLLSNKTFEEANNFKMKVDSYARDKNLPTESDLMSSALKIAQLQKNKILKTDKVTKGFFGNIKRRNGLSTEDCYQVGKYLNAAHAFSSGAEWLTEALRRYDEYYDQHQVKAVEILEELVLSFLGNNQIEEAEKVIKKVSRMNANSHVLKVFESNKMPVDAKRKTFPPKNAGSFEKKKLCHSSHFLSSNIFTCPT